MQTNEQLTNLHTIILELEKKYPYFKKMDIYSMIPNFAQLLKAGMLYFMKINSVVVEIIIRI